MILKAYVKHVVRGVQKGKRKEEPHHLAKAVDLYVADATSAKAPVAASFVQHENAGPGNGKGRVDLRSWDGALWRPRGWRDAEHVLLDDVLGDLSNVAPSSFAPTEETMAFSSVASSTEADAVERARAKLSDLLFVDGVLHDRVEAPVLRFERMRQCVVVCWPSRAEDGRGLDWRSDWTLDEIGHWEEVRRDYSPELGLPTLEVAMPDIVRADLVGLRLVSAAEAVHKAMSAHVLKRDVEFFVAFARLRDAFLGFGAEGAEEERLEERLAALRAAEEACAAIGVEAVPDYFRDAVDRAYASADAVVTEREEAASLAF